MGNEQFIRLFKLTVTQDDVSAALIWTLASSVVLLGGHIAVQYISLDCIKVV